MGPHRGVRKKRRCDGVVFSRSSGHRLSAGQALAGGHLSLLLPQRGNRIGQVANRIRHALHKPGFYDDSMFNAWHHASIGSLR